MFFIGVFGIGNGRKEVRRIESGYCKKCNTAVSGVLFKEYTYFHFFFIKVFKWNTEYYFICDRCTSIYKVKNDAGNLIASGSKQELTYWDIEGDTIGGSNVCPNCRHELEPRFEYCPYCGWKL